MTISVQGWRGLLYSGDIKEMDAKEGHNETHKEGDGVRGVGCVETLEEDEGGDDCSGGEADVVHRVHAKKTSVEKYRRLVHPVDGVVEGQGDSHIGGECIKGFVKVVHLNKDAEGNDDAEDVGTWVSELVFATEGEFDCYAEAFDGHDGDRTND